MKCKEYILLALAIPVAIMSLSSTVRSGTSSYDMSRLLNEPHPFASTLSAPQPPAVITLQRFGKATYSIPGGSAIPLNMRSPYALNPIQVSASNRAPKTNPSVQLSQVKPRSNDPSFLTMGGGYFDINDNESAVEIRAEWRGRKMFWHLHPLIGAMGTGDGALYGYVGAAVDFFFGKRIS
ncbi:MAG: hypothetical protein GKS01_04705 [Alphaproteobacteria bacterium]|nr:hypothetical protein [Alphaproteobacteria bacterium]